LPEFEVRPLHLHSLESLLADLVNGRPIATGAGDEFTFSDDGHARSGLAWYRKKGVTIWSANVSGPQVEDLVDSIHLDPPSVNEVKVGTGPFLRRRLRLKKVEAHRFAGLHKFGTPSQAPNNFAFEFSSAMTLFEGRNGSGKTSLMNAIVWALTGELLRPQREPEPAEDYNCSFPTDDAGVNETTHRISAVTPLPNSAQFRAEATIPADTWVELTFEDQDGNVLKPVRRSQHRSRQGKLQETAPDFSHLGVDPISLRLGTVMPGLLPLIRLGTESELGRAVSQLTGLSKLVDLADHVRRARTKIKNDLTKARQNELKQVDYQYETAKADLRVAASLIPEMPLACEVPGPSDDQTIETSISQITTAYRNAQIHAYESVRGILGDTFDPEKPELLLDLEKNVGRAVERASRPQDLESAKRLSSIRRIPIKELHLVEGRISELLAEASVLVKLAEDPSLAARTRLYARIAAWMAEHPAYQEDPSDRCIVCGLDIHNAVDPVTGSLVKEHIAQAHSNSDLLSKTLKKWADAAEADLLKNLPEALRAAAVDKLPPHPCDLLRCAVTRELFTYDPFVGVLASLKADVITQLDQIVAESAPLSKPLNINLPKECNKLESTLQNLELAIRFARWRNANDSLVQSVLLNVLGTSVSQDQTVPSDSLLGRLAELEKVVKAAKPISDALLQCARLDQALAKRRKLELRLTEYQTADVALEKIAEVGRLADEQVQELRRSLSGEAALWRSKIYLGAFPASAQELVDTPMGRNGELGISVKVGGYSAPAQHVSNASALRANLVAFFLAFWAYVTEQRGGITTLLLDDPQELLDEENRDRLAGALLDVVSQGAQLIVTSYDSRFCSRASRLQVPGGVIHFGVYPATDIQPVIRLCQPLSEIEKRRQAFEADVNNEECGRNFVDACRVFLEAKLGDLFDDPAYSAWAAANPDPTLATFVQRLRPLVKNGPEGMFNQHVFKRFVDMPSLTDRSPVLTLMNKSHHGHRLEIRAADAALHLNELIELVEIAEELHEECLRWRRRDRLTTEIVQTPIELTTSVAPAIQIPIWPSLAASTHYQSTASQESIELLDPSVLQSKSAFLLLRQNFGFAAPEGAIALVETVDGPVADRRLVIARTTDRVFARRVVRGVSSNLVGLTADVLDPRSRTPKTLMLSPTAVALHQVAGIVFDHSLSFGFSNDEAVQVDIADVLRRVKIGFRIKDESAVPLALEKQVVLGGDGIDLSDLGRYEGKLVAVALDDGSSLFKRVGATLPGDLGHLRQFESIGGLGSSQIIAIGESVSGIRSATHIRLIIGVLYHG